MMGIWTPHDDESKTCAWCLSVITAPNYPTDQERAYCSETCLYAHVTASADTPCICGHGVLQHARTKYGDTEDCCAAGCECEDYESEIERAKAERAGEWMSR